MHRTLIVARMNPEEASKVAEIFAESDRGALPKLVGAVRRSLYRFHDLYFHLIEAEHDLGPVLETVRHHPLFKEVSAKLSPHISAYDPATWRHPKDAMAEEFYRWPPEETRPSARVTKVARAEVKPNPHWGGDVRTLLSPANSGATSGFMGTVALEPGETVGEHYHPYSEEFMYLVEGKVTLRVEGNPMELCAGEALLVPKHTRHRLENHGAEKAFLVYHIGPLAPRPDLGHVNTEAQAEPGGAR